MVNPFDNPQLHHYLSSSQGAAVVFIGPKPPARREIQPDCQLHVHSLDELTASTSSELQAQLAKAVSAETESNASGAGNTPDTSLTAVLQLESNIPGIDAFLGKAVRMFPYRLLVCCPDRTLADNHFFAFGFRRLDALCTPLAACESLRWYEYRMCDYKSPPDWLNPRFWANPERFDEPEEPDLYCDDEEE